VHDFLESTAIMVTVRLLSLLRIQSITTTIQINRRREKMLFGLLHWYCKSFSNHQSSLGQLFYGLDKIIQSIYYECNLSDGVGEVG
jgi:hypothetical protein